VGKLIKAVELELKPGSPCARGGEGERETCSSVDPRRAHCDDGWVVLVWPHTHHHTHNNTQRDDTAVTLPRNLTTVASTLSRKKRVEGKGHKREERKVTCGPDYGNGSRPTVGVIAIIPIRNGDVGFSLV
jgi:hypothetical protein